jgi:hypothetical protein
MPKCAMLTERRPGADAVGEPQVFDKLREPVRSGYSPTGSRGATEASCSAMNPLPT